jgi:hypothetical protein
MIRRRNQARQARAALIAELPFALWVLFFLLLFPFLDMTTVLLRYTFIVAATRDGVHAAAQSKTFLSNASAGDLSAVNAAPQAVTACASGFSEITVSSVQTVILATNITNLHLTQYNNPLAQPADTTANLYEIETIVKGQVNPLIDVPPTGMIPAIPGFTAPVPVTVAAREYCEYPQGLNQ